MTALAKIHVAKRDLGLDDDTYRDLLERETGRRSAKGMSSAEMDKVLSAMKRSGFNPASKRRSKPLSGPYAAKAQALWIALWNLGAVEDRRDSALLAFFARQTGIARTEWVLDARDGCAVVEALKSWCAREGVDWTDGTRHGHQIASAQWRKMSSSDSPMSGFWFEIGSILKRSTLTARPSDAEWITVMNTFGRQIRAKGTSS